MPDTVLILRHLGVRTEYHQISAYVSSSSSGSDPIGLAEAHPVVSLEWRLTIATTGRCMSSSDTLNFECLVKSSPPPAPSLR